MKFRISIKTLGYLVVLAILIFTALYLFRLIVNQGVTPINTLENNSVREIAVTAKKFSFEPNPIRLKLNERVRFRLTSLDVTHGFSIPDFGIDQVIEPGKETVIDFHASKGGRYSFLCSVQCGTGHSGMRGTIVIE